MKKFVRNLVFSAMLICPGPILATPRGQDLSLGPFLLAQAEQRPPARISMSDALEIARRSTGGRVLNATETHQDGRNGYRIKVLTPSGEVRVFFVDSSSGAIQQE